jgi:hypothetical protein
MKSANNRKRSGGVDLNNEILLTLSIMETKSGRVDTDIRFP